MIVRLRRLWPPALAAVLIVVALLAWGIPWLTKSRPDMTATPTPPPFANITPILLEPGARACEDQVALSTDTRTVIVLSARFEGTGPPLRVEARAPGYRGQGEILGGYHGLEGLPATIPAPPRNAIGSVCVENIGRRDALLQGTIEGRIQSRSVTSVDDTVIPQKMSLLLSTGQNRSIADRLGQTFERIAAFKPPVLAPAVLAILALLVLVGVPAGVIYAVARGIGDEEP